MRKTTFTLKKPAQTMFKVFTMENATAKCQKDRQSNQSQQAIPKV